jgi:hypothetical protein
MVHKQTGVAIVVSSGDANVGVPGRNPRSKNRKGSEAFWIVAVNEKQLPLFRDQPRFQPLPRLEEQITWLLLIYSDEIQTLRAELSLPVGIDETGHVSQWQERIILNLPAFDGGLRREQDDEGPEDIEVVVRPRG